MLIVIGTIFAIYTEGEWTKILSLSLTALGVVLALWQIAFPPTSTENAVPKLSNKDPIILPATPKDFKDFRDQQKASLTDNYFGALIVYANKDNVGSLVYIYRELPDLLPFYTQFRIQPLPTRAYENDYHDMRPAYIAQHQINNRYLYAAVFPRLRPETYHVALHSNPEFSLLNKTVIDVRQEWRHPRGGGH